jgi:hypothetical protein
MDAFEDVVAAILRRDGWWTMTSVKVELSQKEKLAIGRGSSPRWELDVVAYKGLTNELLVVECKSYLDSAGVRVETFEGKRKPDEDRYKLFFDDNLRSVVFGRLKRQFHQAGFCKPRPKIRFGLAAGKVHGKGGEKKLEAIMRRKHWKFLSPSMLRAALVKLRDSKYENSVASVTAKILLRNNDSGS